MWASPIDTDDEILEECYEVAVRISGSSTWAQKLMCKFRKVFNNAQDAADYASDDDEQGGDVLIFDEKNGAVTYRRGNVKYLGNDRWAGYLVTFRAVGTAPATIWNVELPSVELP